MANLAQLDPKVQDALILGEALRRRKTNRIDWYYPDSGPLRRELYQKHLAFFGAGERHTERCMMAANRVGKTEGMGGFEVACHLTGIYPSWWTGRRYRRPVKGWCAGDTSITVRDILQFKMLGPWGQFGTGLIRGDAIVRYTTKRNVSEAIDQVVVRHVSGGLSYLTFKSYDQKRESFQGTEQDFVWLDEEPPQDIYSECLTRVMTTGGMILATFTPLKGIGDVILGFMDKDLAAHKVLLHCTWDDVPHLTAKMKEELWSSYTVAERDARSKGIPTIGSGRIYPLVMDEILVDDFPVPRVWRRAYALDVGWNKTAALWGALDSDSDILYCYSEYYVGQKEPELHSSAIKARGDWIPGCIDPAANGRGQKDGEQLMTIYQAQGLNLINADNSIDAGITETWSRLSTGRLKVFRKSCQDWQMEFPLYHRDDKGKIVTKRNHLMDCMRYLCMTGIQVASWPPSMHQSKNFGRRNWRTN